MALSELLRRYEAIYAALYSFSLKRWRGDEEMASFFTACTLAGATIMNVALCAGIVVAVRGPFTGLLSKGMILAASAAIFVVSYLLFIHNDRHRQVLVAYTSRPSSKQRDVAKAVDVLVGLVRRADTLLSGNGGKDG